jgi:hypothetical protein
MRRAATGGTYIISYINYHGPSYRPTDLFSGRNSYKSTFARFSVSFDFGLLQQYRVPNGRDLNSQ